LANIGWISLSAIVIIACVLYIVETFHGSGCRSTTIGGVIHGLLGVRSEPFQELSEIRDSKETSGIGGKDPPST
jgi:hypothetical protein